MMSLPSRGVWIEIPADYGRPYLVGSLPSRGVWIEISRMLSALRINASLPSRGVWIEIGLGPVHLRHRPVTPLTGSVD